MTGITDFYVGDKTDKPVYAGSAVNVLYFTNRCNLACTYCYEDLPGRPPQILSKEDIEKSVDAILERESNEENQTLIVLFGGEATLEWDNVCYCMTYAYSKKKNIHFNLSTNGLRFLSQRFINKVKSNYFYSTGLMSIDISFDGVGNKDRIFHNGMDSTATMLKIFSKLNENGVRFRIRYTIHSMNINHMYEDMTRIIKLFKPQRLITSVAWDQMTKDDLETLEQSKNHLRVDWINNAISAPICELFCDMCNGCGERKQLKTYFTDEGNVTTYDNYENASKFHDFKDKETK
jgi:sulfatase maturation enzyme AslB (radical SAM superfamily)